MNPLAEPRQFTDPTLGTFTVEAMLGRGAIGQVFRVRNEWGRSLALKVLFKSSATLEQRLRREARAMAMLDHENIVMAHGVVEVDGAPGLLMELVDGPNLGALLDQGPLSAGRTDWLARAILAGMEHAHSHGMVHRDLKPSNVLLARTDDGPVPKVTDFGLVKLQSNTHTLTHTGMVMGTRGYMPPEQLRDAKRADARSDVFALGALIYALAAGRPPFGSGHLGEVLEAILDERYVPLDQISPDLGPERLAVVRRALKPNPADRFADVQAMRAAWPTRPLSASWEPLDALTGAFGAPSHTTLETRATFSTGETTTGDVTPTPGGSEPSTVHPLKVGDVLSEFALVGFIGRGGMGEVWEAEQHHPRRRVALKTIHPNRVSRGARKRFRHEAELLGQLQHPGIPQIYAAGEDRGRLFLAMEKVEGQPLDVKALAARPVHDRVRMVIQICEAVQHAHLRGVLHRDIKPDNILLDPSGQPKVLDFGIAHTIDTATSRVAGTPAYMSPEQFAGKRLDVRSDVYAIGVVAFELLVGHRPSVEHSAPTDHQPGFDTDLDAILTRATARSPDHRYPSATALSDDLQRFLDHRPVVARPATPAYVARRWLRRNSLLAAALTTVAASLLAVAVGTTWSALRVRAALASEQALRVEAEQAHARSEAQRQAAEAVTEFFVGVFEEADPDKAASHDITVREAVVRSADEVLAGQLVDSPVVDLRVRRSLVQTLIALGEPELALSVSGLFIDQLDTAPASNDLIFGALAVVYLYRKTHERTDEALALLDRIERRLPELDPTNPKQVLKLRASVPHSRGRLLTQKGDYTGSLEQLRRAREMTDQLDDPTAGWNQYADGLVRVGRLDEAEALYQKSHATTVATHGPFHPQTASDLTRLGKMRLMRGDIDGGLALYEQAYAIRLETLGPDHERTIWALEAPCFFLTVISADDRVGPCVERATKAGSTRGLSSARFVMNLQQGNLDAAERILLEEETRSPGGVLMQEGYAAELQAARGDHAGALERLEHIVAGLEAMGLEPGSPYMTRSYTALRRLRTTGGE